MDLLRLSDIFYILFSPLCSVSLSFNQFTLKCSESRLEFSMKTTEGEKRRLTFLSRVFQVTHHNYGDEDS